MIKAVLVENNNSSPSKVSLWKHCKTNELSLWEDYFSMDKNWYGFDSALVDTEAKIVEGDTIYLKSIGKNGQVGVYSYDEKNKTHDLTTKEGVHYPFSTLKYFNKVIAISQLSPQSIQLLINYYNEYKCMPEDIDVKEEEDCKCKKSKDNPRVVSKKTMTCLQCNKSILKTIKLNQQGEVKITIPKVEEANKAIKAKEKLYTEEEVRELCIKSLSMGFDLNNCPYPRLDDKTGKDYWEEWFNKNKK
jgi:hypothetical protein